jgi:hypothetical protein
MAYYIFMVWSTIFFIQTQNNRMQLPSTGINKMSSARKEPSLQNILHLHLCNITFFTYKCFQFFSRQCWSFRVKRVTHCPKMLIIDTTKGLIHGNHPPNKSFFKPRVILHKTFNGQCAGTIHACREGNLSFLWRCSCHIDKWYLLKCQARAPVLLVDE